MAKEVADPTRFRVVHSRGQWRRRLFRGVGIVGVGDDDDDGVGVGEPHVAHVAVAPQQVVVLPAELRNGGWVGVGVSLR